MTEKKKIDLKKQEFKWGNEDGVENLPIGSKDDIPSLSSMVDGVNKKPLDNLSPVAQNRKEQRGNIDNAVNMIPASVKDMESEKTEVGKQRDKVKESYSAAVESISISGEAQVVDSKEVNEDSNVVSKAKSSKVSKSEIDKFKGNVKDLWKSILGVAILSVAIIIGISYKDPKTQKPVEITPADNPVEKNEHGTTKENLKVITSDNKAPVSSDVVSQGNVAVPVHEFNQSGLKKETTIVSALTLNNVLPGTNNKTLNTISLAQWPNAVSLEDVPSNIESIVKLFPEHLYKKNDVFQESLVIYDKRSAEQEKFVRQSQSCYFFPKENNGNWMGINFYMISYCFLNSQFIGFNLYTNNGPDVMKKVETSVLKYPYLHISSVQKLNGFNIINVEQNQAYKILEDYRVQLLNNMISKK